MNIAKNFFSWISVLFPIAGCVSAPASEEGETTVAEAIGTGSCGSNARSASGSGIKNRRHVLAACIASDFGCRQRTQSLFSGYVCPPPYALMNEAENEAVADCDSRLGAALATVACPSSCPNASSGGTCVATPPAGNSLLGMGNYGNTYWAIWCDESANASASGSGAVTCASSCGDGGDGGDGGCKEAAAAN